MKNPRSSEAELVRAAFEEHALRAETLVADVPAAREPLRFAAGLYRAQARMAARLCDGHAERPLTGALDADADAVIDALPALWDLIASGPGPLAELERERAGEPREVARGRLLLAWSVAAGVGAGANGAQTSGASASGDAPPAARPDTGDWMTRMVLRPYLAALAVVGVAPQRARPPGSCPACGGAPRVSSRRTLPETDGATRFLHCALCGSEWKVNRISCPWCREEDPAKLVNYQAEQLAGARIEACETCGRYLKSIDRSTDMRRVPEVDDVATLALDLWAAEQGLERGEPGLLGA